MSDVDLYDPAHPAPIATSTVATAADCALACLQSTPRCELARLVTATLQCSLYAAGVDSNAAMQLKWNASGAILYSLKGELLP